MASAATAKPKIPASPKVTAPEVTASKLDPKKVKLNDIMALVYWVKIVGTWNGGNDLKVKDIDSKEDFDVHGKSLVEKSFSADAYDKEEKVTMTAMAEKLVNAWNVPFTVEFKKTDNTIRKLRGKLLEPEPLMGRSRVLDFDIETGTPLRLVDHREIQSLILGNIKYVLKK